MMIKPQIQDDSLSIYIHIPFCQTKCPYCDFNTYSGIESLIPDYVKAINSEIHYWGDSLNNLSVRTIFFGGGTPSYLPEGHLESILDQVYKFFQIEDTPEITISLSFGMLIEMFLRLCIRAPLISIFSVVSVCFLAI